MIGKRIQPDENGYAGALRPGEFVRVVPLRRGDGIEFTEDEKTKWWNQPYWMACTPNGHVGNLQQHEIVEHEDGTITVSPSILINLPATPDAPYKELWHGYLERGVWRAC